MKRIFTTCLAAFLLAVSAQAQDVWCHFGLQGGISLNRFTTEIKDNMTGWHAGASLLVKMPAFFAIQPAVQFEHSKSKILDSAGQTGTLDVNTINVPISIQWGPDLGFCRVFAEVVPFFDFNLSGTMGETKVNDYINLFQFGAGLGGGIDIWRFQLSARYNWNFGNWQKMVSEGNPFKNINDKKQGVSITLAYFFN